MDAGSTGKRQEIDDDIRVEQRKVSCVPHKWIQHTNEMWIWCEYCGMHWTAFCQSEMKQMLQDEFHLSASDIVPKRYVLIEPLAWKTALIVLSGFDTCTAHKVVVKIGTSNQLDNEYRVLKRMNAIDAWLADGKRPERLTCTDYVVKGEVKCLVVAPKGLVLSDAYAAFESTTQLLVGQQLSDHLQFLYDRYGLLHCDIKPTNVIVMDACSNALAIDFGCSLLLSDVEITTTEIVTEAYASINQLFGYPITRVDEIHSLCATMMAIEMGVERYGNKYHCCPLLRDILTDSPLAAAIYRYATRNWCILNTDFDALKTNNFTIENSFTTIIDVSPPPVADDLVFYYAHAFFSINT